MKYFSVTVMEKGKKRTETVKAANRMAAVQAAKQKFPRTLITKALETSAPLEDTLATFLEGIKKSSKKKIPIQDKISTIRQIAVMTDAGIAINDTLLEVSDNTQNKQLKEIYAKVNSDINAGNSMSDAMEPFTEEFGHVALAMTKFRRTYRKYFSILS